MLRRCLSAALVMFVVTGLVLGGTYNGLITSVSKDEVKIMVKKDKKDKKAEEKVFKVSKDAKFAKKSGKETSDITLDDITKAISDSKGGKGVGGSITTEGEGDKETVTKITIAGKKKK